VLFLVAYGSVFRAETPALLGQMGQLLTITILGGACFGMPTALVAERERGIWRRYRLLPIPTGALVGSVLAARLVIVVSAAALQIGLAHVVYGTPLPLNPMQTLAAVFLVTAAFLGLGLLVAALADDVPSVQALGQCLFLPMIMIGGVGIPLLALPRWAQELAGFMPGRYAVDLLQLGYCDLAGIRHGGFNIVALAVIGGGAACVGAKTFRWEAGRRVGRSAWAWAAAALLAWLAIGLAAAMTGHLAPELPPDIGYAAITDGEIDSITFKDLPGDQEFVSRLAPPFGDGEREKALGDFAVKLGSWGPGHGADAGQSVRYLLCVAGIADVSQDLREGEIARHVLDDLRARYGDERLSRILAWIILYPRDGDVLTSVPALGLSRRYREDIVRERTVLYAKKFLGRLRGRIKD